MKVELLTFSESHISERYVGWLNDPLVVQYSELRHARHSTEDCFRFFNEIKLSDNFFWAIEVGEERDHVGNIVAYVDSNNSVADLTILLGERSVWGKGVASEALRKAIQLLEQSGIRRLSGGTMAVNRAMIAVFEKLGFSEEGRRREHFVFGSEFVDLVCFGRLLQ